MSLQVLADAGEVGLQPVHAGMGVVTVTQYVVQVVVEDVGVEAADLQVVLEEGERSEVGFESGERDSSLLLMIFFFYLVTSQERLNDSHLVRVDSGHQSGAGVVLRLQTLSLKRHKTR